MKLTVLGCSGSAPGPESSSSSYVVEHEGFRVLLDLGSGSFGAMLRHHSVDDIDAVVLSHLHPDHCADLAPMIVALRYGPFRRRVLPVYGPEGTLPRIGRIYEPIEIPEPVDDVLEWRPQVAGELGPFTLRFAPMNHPVPTAAVRLEVAGRSLVYTGDTGVSDALVDLARGADVLLSEATYRDSDPYVPNLHLRASEAGAHARAAGVDRLIVTHVPPWGSRDTAVAEAGETFGGPVSAATADATYEI